MGPKGLWTHWAHGPRMTHGDHWDRWAPWAPSPLPAVGRVPGRPAGRRPPASRPTAGVGRMGPMLRMGPIGPMGPRCHIGQ